jgi:hypothetical protein
MTVDVITPAAPGPSVMKFIGLRERGMIEQIECFCAKLAHTVLR